MYCQIDHNFLAAFVCVFLSCDGVCGLAQGAPKEAVSHSGLILEGLALQIVMPLVVLVS